MLEDRRWIARTLLETEAKGVYFTSLGEPTCDEIDPGWRIRRWSDLSL